MAIGWQNACIDCGDPIALGRWWAELLGWRVMYEDDDEVAVEPPKGSPQDGVSPDLVFLKVPEAKTIKNRMHVCLRPEDQAVEVARAESLGATRVDVGQGEEATWVVMADPEGNEFCILRAFTADELASL